MALSPSLEPTALPPDLATLSLGSSDDFAMNLPPSLVPSTVVPRADEFPADSNMPVVSLLAEMGSGQSDYNVSSPACSAELCGHSTSGAPVELSDSGLNLEEMESTLQQANFQSTLNSPIHFVFGPVK